MEQEPGVGLRLDRGPGRPVDASDIIQDVLLKASQRLGDDLRNPSLPFHLWPRQLAQDQVVEASRKHRAVGKRSLDRECPLHVGAAFADRSSLDLAAQLRDPSLTPEAAALR